MKNKHFILAVILIVVCFLNACDPLFEEDESSHTITDSTETTQATLITPTPTQDIQTTEPLPTALQPTEMLEQEFKEFTYTLDLQKIGQHCLEVPQMQILSPLYLGDHYMVNVLEQKSLFSVSTEDGTISPLYTTEFPHGHPAGGVEIKYPWYTYVISEMPSGLGDWNLHLVNIEEGTNTVIANRDLFDSALLLHIGNSLQAGTLFLSASTFDGYEILTSRLYAIDLATKEARLVIDSQEKNTFMSFISASNGYIVIENDPPKTEPDLHLTLYDLSTSTWRDLPQTYPASVPSMDYPYVVWKNNTRFASATSLTIHNIETGESIIREVVGSFTTDPSISNGYIIAEASTGKDTSKNSVIVYSPENGDAYAIQMGINEVSTKEAYIDDGSLIWAFTTVSNMDDFSSYICRLPLEKVFSNAVEGIEVQKHESIEITPNW